MPNPIRLRHLTELREQTGLTLADMAERCALHGSQSRKAVSNWEAGTSIPRANRRIPFINYLWHDLQLYQEPAAFEKLWSILVEEWAWDPLSAEERAQLLVPVVPTAVAAEAMTEGLVAAPDADEAVVAAAVQHAAVAPETPSSTPAVPSADENVPMGGEAAVRAVDWRHQLSMLLADRRWLVVGIMLLVLAGFGAQYLWRVQDEAAPDAIAVVEASAAAGNVVTQTVAASGMIAPAITVTNSVSAAVLISSTVAVPLGKVIPDQPLTLHNGSFEEGTGFDGWALYEECGYAVQEDVAVAHQGASYLAIRKQQPRCYSVYQDIVATPAVSTTVRAAIWLRSPTGATRRGRLTLWAFSGQKEKAEQPFAVANRAWTCVETALTIKEAGHDQLRLELYLDSPDGLDYYVDSATLGQGSASLCPAPTLTIADLQVLQPSGLIYAGATVGVAAIVQNGSPTDLRQESFLRYSIAETADDEPLDPGANRILAVPPLAAGESITLPHLDLYLPINLPPDQPTEQPYFVVVDVAGTDDPADLRRGFDRASQPFTVTPCSQGTLYCDVPTDHWAAAEIQAWYDAGISQGCRSNTEPFLNRPFCPDALVQRWMMVFFLLRRLEGKDYQPTAAYQGLFEDLPEEFDSHNGARWIEALVTTRVDMHSDACPPRGEHQRFCPNDPLRRIDFARALYELQRWDLTNVAGTHYADLQAGSLAASIAEFMWEQGFLVADEIDCPDNAGYPRFCPNAPLRRAAAAVMMSRALGLVAPVR